MGEYYVLRSIIEHSIPHLIGWSTMLEHNMEQAVLKSARGSGNYNNTNYNTNNYNNNRGGGGGGSGSGSGSDSENPHNYTRDDSS